MPRNHWFVHWPTLVGTVVIAVSCALLKAPPDLTSDSNLDDVFIQGEFREPDGEVTEGGTVSGSWDGSCDMYGYPYQLELTLCESDGAISGTGRWITSWCRLPVLGLLEVVAEVLEIVLGSSIIVLIWSYCRFISFGTK